MNISNKRLSIPSSCKLESVNKFQNYLQQEAAKKYEKFKKSASLPAYYLSRARLNKVAGVCKSLSAEKLVSALKLKKTSTLEKKMSPYGSLHNNTINFQNNKTKRLVLNPKNAENLHKKISSQECTKLLDAVIHLEQVAAIKMENFFLPEYYSVSIQSSLPNRKDEFKLLLSRYFKAVKICETRKWEHREKEVRKEYSKLEAEISQACLQIEKKKMKVMLLTKEVETLQERLKQKTYSDSKDASTSTSDMCPTVVVCRQPSSHKIAIDPANGPKDELKDYRIRERQLLNVLLALKRSGIDIEGALRTADNQSSDEDGDYIMEQCVKRILKQQKVAVGKCKDVSNQEDCDADQSIISSTDGISFNYEDKSVEEDVYTVRHKHEKPKELPEMIRQKLGLNFDIFYELESENEFKDQTI